MFTRVYCVEWTLKCVIYVEFEEKEFVKYQSQNHTLCLDLKKVKCLLTYKYATHEVYGLRVVSDNNGV